VPKGSSTDLGLKKDKFSYLAQQCFSKYCDSKTVSPDVRRSAAIAKWLATEERNLDTNFRLLDLAEVDFGWTTGKLLRTKIRKIIQDTLGPRPTFKTLEFWQVTNGASTRVGRSEIAAMQKLTGIAHVSSSAFPHWVEMTKYTVMSNLEVEVHDSSSMFTVPKSTDIDRVACKEPEINMFLQRSCGKSIARALRLKGIKLDDQSVNQKLAATAVKRKLATIDLSSASDSISTQLVYELLPIEWVSLLDDLRVKEVLIDGHSHRLQMFSSMGNGFTFELESLLFWAITRAVCWLSGIKGPVSVFGDDIIAPNQVVPRLKRVFDFLGFKLNLSKSFWSGPFRESCGKHYYNGVDVSPFFVRKSVDHVSELIRILNRLLEWNGRGWGFFLDPEFATFHRKWSLHVPQKLWGGQDIESIESLVTGHRPRFRLLMKSEPAVYRDEDAYLLWHVSRRHMGEVALETKPSRQTEYEIVPQTEWLERTTWTPYLIMREDEPGGAYRF